MQRAAKVRRGILVASILVAALVALWLLVSHRGAADNAAIGSTNTVRRIVEVQLANRTVSVKGFPERFCQHQKPSARNTAPYVLALAEGASKIEAIKAVRQCGARVIGPMPPKALLVETSIFALAKLSVDPHFAAATELLPEDKIDARLKPLLAAEGGPIPVTVIALAMDDVHSLAVGAAAQGGELVKGCLNSKSAVTLQLPRKVITELAGRGDVRWLEPFVRPKLLNDCAVGPTAMNVREVWNAHGLSGKGQLITTSDSGIDTGNLATMHADLRNQVIGIGVVDGCCARDISGHGTHTAGSIVGDGTMSGGAIRGAAYGAKLWAWFCCLANDSGIMTPDRVDVMFRPLGTTNACIHSASWGSDDSGAYSSQCVAIDEYVWEHPDFLPVIANGNSGSSAQTVGSPATAKNVLAVGAAQNARSGHDGGYGNGDPTKIASFSSRGPCKDGRIKPDVCAPGVGVLSTRSYACSYSYGIHDNTNYAYNCGTSMATPLTAGTAALVRQWLVERRGFTNAPPTAALIKAVLTGGAKNVSVPDHAFGWGCVDLGATLYPSNRAVKLIDRIPFGESSEQTYEVTLTNVAPLEVQLVWIDRQATYGAASTLVNDLDLVVSNKTTGAVWFGNGIDGGDHTNTVESVRIASAEAGTYAVFVRGYDVSYESSAGGAAALYLRGAFEGEAETVSEPAEDPKLQPLAEGKSIAVDAVKGDDATATGGTDHPYATLSAAVAAAAEGDVLQVKAGSYEGGIEALVPRLRIEAVAGPESTIIDGGGTNFCFFAYNCDGVVLSGFTLTNGYLQSSNYYAYGAGTQGGTLTNCVIVDCHVKGDYSFGGGAMGANLIDCKIVNCSSDNSGGGVYDCILKRCTLIGNSSCFGGGACNSELTNCVISKCSAIGPGGGAYNSELVGCTVRGNSAEYVRSRYNSESAGGGVDCQCKCTDTLIWDNTGPGDAIDNWEGYWTYYYGYLVMLVPELYWCCTTPLHSISENSIEADPRFVSTNDLADVRLYEISPCLGAGSCGNIGAYAGSGVVKALPKIDVKTATGEEISNAVASVGYADPAVAAGIGTNGETYAAFQAWSTNGLKATAVAFSTRAYDSFVVRELVATPTLLGDGNETKVELAALEPTGDGSCSTTLRLVDGDTEVPLCSVKAAFAARTRVGTAPGSLAKVALENIATESVDEGRAVKLTIQPPIGATSYFLKFVLP